MDRLDWRINAGGSDILEKAFNLRLTFEIQS